MNDNIPMKKLNMRVERLQKMVELGAPKLLIKNELNLVEDALQDVKNNLLVDKNVIGSFESVIWDGTYMSGDSTYTYTKYAVEKALAKKEFQEELANKNILGYSDLENKQCNSYLKSYRWEDDRLVGTFYILNTEAGMNLDKTFAVAYPQINLEEIGENLVGEPHVFTFSFLKQFLVKENCLF